MSIPTFASGKLDYDDITHSTSQRIKAKTLQRRSRTHGQKEITMPTVQNQIYPCT